jgi:hypothetical protein
MRAVGGGFGFGVSKVASRRVNVGVVLAALVAGLLAATPSVAQAAVCPTVGALGVLTPAPSPGVNWSGCNLVGADLAGKDLTSADLSGADLSNAEAYGVILSGANLSEANLSDAYLPYSVLTGAIMTFANLSGAIMSFANLSGADLYFANLTGADLTGATLTGADVFEADLTGANLTGAVGCGLLRYASAILPAGYTVVEGCLATVPGVPGAVSVAGSVTSATVAWTAPTSNGGTAITGYEVTANPGAKVVNAAAGATSATVTGLLAGVTYTFTVKAKNIVGAGAASAAVTAKGTTLTIKPAATSVVYFSSTSVSGVLKTSTGSVLPGGSVKVLAKPSGAASYSTLGTVTTNASGVYSLTVKPTKNTTYYATYTGGSGQMGSTSSIAVVSVKPRATIALNDSTATRYQTVYFSGKVYPNSPNQTVYLQRYASGKWSNVKSMRLGTASGYRFAWKPTSYIDYSFRVYVPARTGYLAAYTVSKKLVVS